MNVILLGFLIYWPWSPGGRQYINMTIARKSLPCIEALVKADSAFKNVKVSVYTGQDGAIWLVGTVATDDELLRLMKQVAAEKLPVPVAWNVEVDAVRALQEP